jgi:transcription elongation factor
VVAVIEGELGAGDRPHPERRRRLGELHRAEHAVVVGEGERAWPCSAAAPASSTGCEAPSWNEKAEWAWSST